MEWLQPPPKPIFRLDRDELKRMNRLARSAPDLTGYLAWYRELSELDQRALTCHLLRFGCEYNDGSQWSEVLRAAGPARDDPLVRHLEACRPQADSPGAWGFQDHELFPWLESLPEDERESVFRFAAAFFGLNERQRYEVCRREGACSHWWHQE